MKTKKIRYTLFFIGFIFIVYFLYRLDFRDLLKLEYNLSVLPYLLFLMITFFVLKTTRWFVLLRKLGVRISFIRIYLVSMPAISFAELSPGQVGEYFKIEYLKRNWNVARRKSLSSLLIEKAMDVLVVALLFCLGIFYIPHNKLSINWGLILFFLVFILILGFILLIVLSKKLKIVKDFIFYNRALISDFKIMFLTFLVTILVWFNTAAIWFLISRVINLELTFFIVLVFSGVMGMINILSFIPGGIGVIEISGSFILREAFNISLLNSNVFMVLLRIFNLFRCGIGQLHTFFLK